MAVVSTPKQGQETKVERRAEQGKKSIKTAIWQETATTNNPYLTESCRCYGYDLFELMGKCHYSEVLYLLFRGDLPNQHEADLLEQLQIAIITPGVRHPAVQASMSAATSRSDATNILPIGLSLLGGEHLGGAEVEQSMRFLKKKCNKSIEEIMIQQVIPTTANDDTKGDIHPVPGFGSRYGGIDPMASAIAEQLCKSPGAGDYLKWSTTLVNELIPHNIAWLIPGVVAATLLDLGFHPRMGAGVYQLLSAPGLLAHAWEYDDKPFNSLPFPDDRQYYIEDPDASI